MSDLVRTNIDREISRVNDYFGNYPELCIVCSGSFPYVLGMEENEPDKKDVRPNGFLRMRDLWIDYVNQHHDVSHVTARIGIFIALRMNSIDRCMWWNVGRIAKALHVSTATVTKSTQELERLNLMIVRRNKRTGNVYYIRLPIELDTL